MSDSESGLQRTADRWGAEGAWQVGRGIYWLELPAVQRRLNRKVSGRPDVDWIQYTLERHFAGRLPLERCLSLGCGEGELERRLASLGVFLACDASDIADVSIRQAQAAALAAGYNHVHYAVHDLNRLALPTAQYDAVWASGAVHHFERLEHVFEQVAALERRATT